MKAELGTRLRELALAELHTALKSHNAGADAAVGGAAGVAGK